MRQIHAIMATPDIRQAHTQKAICTFKETTAGIPVILHVEDNNSSPYFKNSITINRAIRACNHGDYLLTLDDDVWFENNGWLQRCADVLDNNPHVAIVAPCQWWNEEKPPQPTDIGRKQFVGIQKSVYVPWVGMACSLLRVSGLRVSNQFRHYYIDPDYCYACWRDGMGVAAIPERIFHEPCKSINATIGKGERDTKMRHDSEVFYGIWREQEPIIEQQVIEANRRRPIR